MPRLPSAATKSANGIEKLTNASVPVALLRFCNAEVFASGSSATPAVLDAAFTLAQW